MHTKGHALVVETPVYAEFASLLVHAEHPPVTTPALLHSVTVPAARAHESGERCTGAGRSVRRAIHGTRATSDELCGTVLSNSAGDTGTAIAVGVATGGHTVLIAAATATGGRVAVTARCAANKIAAATPKACVTCTALAWADVRVAAGNEQRHGWLRKRKGRGGAGETDQSPSQPETASRRRSRAPPTSPAVAMRASAVSGGALSLSAFSRWGERTASASDPSGQNAK